MADPHVHYRASVIRKIRKDHNKTLKDLAEKTDLSISFISQIERGIINPSIKSLRKIALSLGIPLSSLFEDLPNVNAPIVRKHERKILFNKDSRLVYQLISLKNNQRIEMLLTRLEVGVSSTDSPMAHKGDEVGLLLQGECRCELGRELYELQEGDSIYITENTPHRFINTGNVPLLIVSAISPPGF